jgi:hypothetical protein
MQSELFSMLVPDQAHPVFEEVRSVVLLMKTDQRILKIVKDSGVFGTKNFVQEIEQLGKLRKAKIDDEISSVNS